MQEINPDDLDAIIPSHDVNSGIVTTTSSNTPAVQPNATVNKVLTRTISQDLPENDGASSSDMELPALVSAAIQRVESCSDAESTKASTTQYTSSLLRDFVVKTQMLGNVGTSSPSPVNAMKINNNGLKSQEYGSDKKTLKIDLSSVPRIISKGTNELINKQGRNKKSQSNFKAQTSESPDSGIISTAHSPTNSPKLTNKKAKEINRKKTAIETVGNIKRKDQNKIINIASLEKSTYATERVLYPPRGKKKGRPPKEKIQKSAPADESLDPLWKKIDLSKKFQEPNLSGYKSDGGSHHIKCSKTLAAQSGYVSDYGNIKTSKLSGYKTDHSRKSGGYRSDFSVKAKSCGYRSDCSTRHRKKVRRKRRKKILSNKPIVNDQDILLLAGLTLGNTSEESSSRDSINTSITGIQNNNNHPTFSSFKGLLNSNSKFKYTSSPNLNVNNPINGNNNVNVKKNNNIIDTKVNKLPLSKANVKRNNDELNKLRIKKSVPSDILDDLCDGFSNAKSRNSEYAESCKSFSAKSQISLKRGDFLENLKNSSKCSSIRMRRLSTMSRCSSRSAGSKHHYRKRRRRRLKSKSSIISFKNNEAKISVEIDQMTDSFVHQCKIYVEKVLETKGKEKPVSESVKSVSKRSTKKRKGSEHTESPSTNSTKRRNKKALPTQSPDEHKLPLKKRHYLLTPGEKSEIKNSPDRNTEEKKKPAVTNNSDKQKPHNEVHVDVVAHKATNSSTKAVTPKKRHLLKNTDIHVTEDNHSAGCSPATGDCKLNPNIDLSITEIIQLKSQSQSKKCDIITRKKNRLEGLVSKIQPNTTSSTPTSSPEQPNIKMNHKNSNSQRPTVIHTAGQSPPPGIFEPSIDLELQIPVTTISLPSFITKTELLDSPRYKETIQKFDFLDSNKKSEGVVEKLLSRTTAHLLKKKKRRKAINRTGFPTLKKRKKKLIEVVPEQIEEKPIITKLESELLIEEMNTDSKMDVTIPANNVSGSSCDRVPLGGEAADTFIERNSRPRLSVVSLERLQGKISPTHEDKNSLSIMAQNCHSRNKKIGISSPDAKHTTEKRYLRDKSKENTSALKRDKPDSPLEVKQINKKPRKEIKNQLLHLKEPRDLSSDNEPLINLVKTETKTKVEEVGMNTVSSPKTNKRKKGEKIVPEKSSVITKVKSSIKQTVQSGKKLNPVAYDRKRKLKADEDSARPINALITIVTNLIEEDSNSLDSLALSKRVRTTNTKSKLKNSPTKVIKVKSKIQSAIDTTKKVRKVKAEEILAITKAETVPDESTFTNLKEIPPVDIISVLEHDPLPISECLDASAKCESTPNANTIEKEKNKKLRKKYLTAGLMSDVYKENGKIIKSTSKDPSNPITVSLPPPIYCEKYLRQRIIDFELPFDLWFAHDNDKLPGRNIVHSWNFRKIRTNVYCDVKPNPSSDQQPCSCKNDSGCPDDCLNRLVYTECSPETCPCQDKCKNQKIQRYEYAPGLERFMTDNKGWGIKSKYSIKQGTYILEYVGEVVNEKEFKERMRTLYVNDIHHYCLNLDGGLVIDGHRMGSDCRFVNHSCSPNCEMQKWSVNGLFRMALFALRDIKPCEELTYDYNFSLFNPSEGQPCRCDTPQCRGVIGGKSQRIKPVETKVSFYYFR